MQFFLTDPQGWKAPAAARGRRGAARQPTSTSTSTRRTVINVATTEQPHPHPEPQAAASATPRPPPTIGAKGLIVHGGHVDTGDDIAAGFDNWRKTFAYAAKDGGFAARS